MDIVADTATADIGAVMPVADAPTAVSKVVRRELAAVADSDFVA